MDMLRFYCFAFLLFFSFCRGAEENKLNDSTRCRDCGKVPYPSNTGYTTPNPIIDSPQVWSFVSEPALHPMKVKINRYRDGTSSGLIILAPYALIPPTR